MESVTVWIEIDVNGKKELGVVERVDIDQWNFPQMIPRLYPGEILVETPTGYKISRIGR
jgi:hypothetical protein